MPKAKQITFAEALSAARKNAADILATSVGRATAPFTLARRNGVLRITWIEGELPLLEAVAATTMSKKAGTKVARFYNYAPWEQDGFVMIVRTVGSGKNEEKKYRSPKVTRQTTGYHRFTFTAFLPGADIKRHSAVIVKSDDAEGAVMVQ